MARVERQLVSAAVVELLREMGILPELGQRAGANQVPSLHRVMILGAGQLVSLAGLADFETLGRPTPGGGSNRVGVETGSFRDPPAAGSAVAQMQGERVVGMSGSNPDRRFEFPAVQCHLDDVFIGQPQTFGRCRAEESRVVPGEFGNRVRRLLKPAVVGEPAVPNTGVGTEDHFQPAARRLGQGGQL